VYLDAHCHLADPRLDATRDQAIAHAVAGGVTGFLQGGVGPDDWKRQRALAARYVNQIFPVYGLHPWWVHDHSDASSNEALKLLETEYTDGVGLGELGLDFIPKRASSATRQTRVFTHQLRLAKKRDLPLVLHLVQAHDEALEIMKNIGVPTRGGIVHSFSGTAAHAKAYRALGLTISVGGPLTRKGFENLKATVVSMPWQEIAIESDSPDQPSESHRGGLNEPATIWEVAAVVAKLHGLGEDGAKQVLESSSSRIARIYGIERRSQN